MSREWVLSCGRKNLTWLASDNAPLHHEIQKSSEEPRPPRGFLRSATDGAKYARHGIHREVPRADPGDRCKLVRRRREASFVLGEQCIKEWASEKDKGGDTQGMHKAQVSV